MTDQNPQVPAPKKKFNNTLLLVIAVLLFLFVVLPICVILAIVAITAVNPAGNMATPTPTSTGAMTEGFTPTTSTPTLVNPTIDPYIGWQTFESTALGISFKYPASFNVQESESAIQIYTEESSGSRPLQITIHNKPFDKEFFASHNVRLVERDRIIQIGDEIYTTSYFFSGEGSPGSTPGETWQIQWITELVEIGERTLSIETSTESIFNKDTNTTTITTSPSQEDLENSELILKSIVFN